MPFASFNQDSSALCVCDEHDYRLYALTNLEKVELLHQSANNFTCNLKSDNRAVIVIPNLDCKQRYKIVERLRNSSLIAVVTESEPCTLKLCHFRKDYTIVSETLKANILSVRLNCQVVVVCTEDEIAIFDVRTMKQSHRMEVSGNPAGLLSLASLSTVGGEPNMSLIAYPTCASTGDLQIFNCRSKSEGILIKAHLGSLAAVSFSQDAALVATASVKGTVIRVFTVEDGSKAHEFRRGLSRTVRVSSLSFCPNRQYLVASSDTETVHIFWMAEENRVDIDKVKEEDSWTGYVTSAIKSTLLPAALISPDRAFATAKLPGSYTHTVSTIVSVKDLLYVMIVTLGEDDPRLHVFEMDCNRGGECAPVSTVVLMSEANNSNNNNLSQDSRVVYPVSRLQSNVSDCVHDADPIHDASYAYKLKSGPLKSADSSHQLTEIVENAGETPREAGESFDLESHQPNLNDKREFPPIPGLSANPMNES